MKACSETILMKNSVGRSIEFEQENYIEYVTALNEKRFARRDNRSTRRSAGQAQVPKALKPCLIIMKIAFLGDE